MAGFRRLAALLLGMVLALALAVPAFSGAPVFRATILFTHDLHSHLLPSGDGEGGTYGGPPQDRH